MLYYKTRRNLIKQFYSLFHWFDKIPYLFNMGKDKIYMPDLLIVGLPKCGTVWLVETIKQHDNIHFISNPFYDNKGEIRFFSKNFNFPIKKSKFK